MASGSHHLTGERWGSVRCCGPSWRGLRSAWSIFPDKSGRVPQGPLQGPGPRQCGAPVLRGPCSTPDLHHALLLPLPRAGGRAAEVIPQTAFEPPVCVRTLLREAHWRCLKLGRELIPIPRGLVGRIDSQAWKEGLEVQTSLHPSSRLRRALLSIPGAPSFLLGDVQPWEQTWGGGGMSRPQERADWLRSASARVWTNQRQLGMGSGCTKGLLGLTTLNSREGPADRRVLATGRTDRVTCGAGGHTSRPRLHEGRVAAVSGNHAETTLSPSPSPPPSLSSLCLPHPLLLQLWASPALSSSPRKGDLEGASNNTPSWGEITWACLRLLRVQMIETP